jgi:hypothetical protein
MNVTAITSFCLFGMKFFARVQRSTDKFRDSKMNDTSSRNKQKKGRPKLSRSLSRPNRVVTFVTDEERRLLESVTQAEDRSMASVVHRIIKAHFEEQ